MGVPMQSSPVHVPCRSGSPHGVFGCTQVLPAEEDLGACATASPAVVNPKIIPIISPGNRYPIRTPFHDPKRAYATSARARAQALVVYCQGKVEMSPCWQSRNVPFCRG